MISTFKQLLSDYLEDTVNLHHIEREAHLLDRLNKARAQLIAISELDTTGPELKGLIAEIVTI